MKQIYFLIILCITFCNLAKSQEVFEAYKRAFDTLYVSTNGDNWAIKDFNTLRQRTEYPRIKSWRFAGKEKEIVDEYYLMFNNLTGTITKGFNPTRDEIEDYEVFGNIRLQYKHINFSYNQIEHVATNIYWGDPRTVTTLDLSHNKISDFKLSYLPRDGIGGYNMGITHFKVNNNNIRSLYGADLRVGSDVDVYLATSVNPKLIDISNNYLTFEHFISVKDAIAKKMKHYNNWGDFKFIVSPQKPQENDHAPQTLEENTSTTVSYQLPHADNMYQWLLNGKEVTFANKSTYEVKNFDKYKAGVYTCRVTNSQMPGVELMSQSFPVFLKKEGNQAPSDFVLTNAVIPQKVPRLALLTELTGQDSDGDQVFFRLIDNEENKDNYSFRIVNGNMLMAAERLFEYKEIEQYVIKVQAYDIYGGTKEKEIVIKPGEVGESIRYPEIVEITGITEVDENVSDLEIGQIEAKRTVEDNGIMVHQVLDEYKFELESNKEDNNHFVIDGNKIKLTNALNYETKSVYTIKIKVQHKTVDYSFYRFFKDKC